MKISSTALLLLINLITMPLLSNAQEAPSWKISVGKKVILTSNNPDDTVTNTLKIKRTDLDNNGTFKVEYTDPQKKATKGTNFRTIAILSPTQTVVVQRDSADQLFLYNRDLLKVIWANKKITICTWATPTDPGIAAAIRIRRLRLCSIEFEEEKQ